MIGAAQGSGGSTSVSIPIVVNVQAQPGATKEDTQMTGSVISDMVESKVRQGIQREMGQGGLLWRRV